MKQLRSVSVSALLVIIAWLAQPQIATTVNYIYVTPIDGCPGDKTHCYTLEDYVNQQDTHFTNNSVFYFLPGLHKLEESIRIINTHNLSFHGALGPGNEKVKIAFNSAASILWENCSDIEITSLVITLVDNFTYSIIFEHTHSVTISNIAILGNGNNGCSSILSNMSMLNITNCQFIGIHGCLGAALMITSSNITFTGSNTFKNNIAINGGAIYLHNSVLIMQVDGVNSFINNSIKFIEDRCRKCNSGWQTDSHLGYGGAVYSNFSTLRLTGPSMVNFSENKALSLRAGGEYYYYGSGGAIAVVNGTFIIEVSAFFYNNKAEDQGGAILLENVNSKFLGSITFENNIADFGGALHIQFRTNISFNVDQMENITLSSVIIAFQRNSANHRGGAIYSHRSILTFTKLVLFEENTAFYGGAMSLFDTSKLILVPRLNISFIKNDAYNRGGALYIHTFQCLLAPLECFLSIQSSDSTTENILLHFDNNSARSTGSTLYGGQLNKCRLYYRTNYTIDECGNTPFHNYSDDALKLFMSMSRIILYNKTESATNISSQAEQIKFCQDKNITMNNDRSIRAHLGEKFNVAVVALDQSGSPVPATIFNKIKYGTYEYRLFPSGHYIAGACHNLSFQLYSTTNDTDGYFKLYLQGPCFIEGLTLKITITIKTCPLGFELSKNQQCSCNKRLLKFTKKCSIDNSIAKIKREKNNFWISQKNAKDLDVLLIHEFRCPLDYCKDIPQDVILSDPSVQCDFNRTGIVCGQCRKDFSLVLGSLHCIQCNDKYTALILFFMMAGVALIAIIFLFQLTVSVGTLNGLFFYANIIQANHQAYFPRATTKFFRVFTSWLNLDLGIETCFYDGMDIYTYSWFQFLFPFYVWFLIGLIILICRYSRLIAKYFGQNPVAVLATLLLMSYSKILSAVIVPLTWTYLTYYTASNETKSVVWMYDASIPYFGEPKHTALGIFAILCLAVFVLPYILLLLIGHWLQGCSNWWILSWLNKIKPFMDAYHAPYRKHTRYWTGLLLITRLGLFLSFANDSESVNTAAVASVTVALLAIRFRVYEHFYNDVLESSFILNLGIFSVATLMFSLNEKSEDAAKNKNQLILSRISVSIAFTTFLGILLFHISLVLKSSNIWKNYMLPFIRKSLLLSKILRITPVKDQTRAGDKDAAELQALPTSTEVDIDLREPLLESTES